MKVDIDAGLYFTGAVMIFASVILIPSTYESIKEAKVYNMDDFVAVETPCESVSTTVSGLQSQHKV